MPCVPTTIEEYYELDLSQFTAECSCEDLRRAINILQMKIIVSIINDCDDELTLQIGGKTINTSKAYLIKRWTEWIKCWTEICETMSRQQHMSVRRTTRWQRKLPGRHCR